MPQKPKRKPKRKRHFELKLPKGVRVVGFYDRDGTPWGDAVDAEVLPVDRRRKR